MHEAGAEDQECEAQRRKAQVQPGHQGRAKAKEQRRADQIRRRMGHEGGKERGRIKPGDEIKREREEIRTDHDPDQVETGLVHAGAGGLGHETIRSERCREPKETNTTMPRGD